VRFKCQLVDSPVHQPTIEGWHDIEAADEFSAAKATVHNAPDRSEVLRRKEIFVCVWSEGDDVHRDGMPRAGQLFTLTMPFNQN
jgi:hypothetical protein